MTLSENEREVNGAEGANRSVIQTPGGMMELVSFFEHPRRTGVHTWQET
jgi:hypothetical protein